MAGSRSRPRTRAIRSPSGQRPDRDRSTARRPRPTGETVVGAYLPLLGDLGRRRGVARVDRLRLAGAAHVVDDDERDAPRRARRAGRRSPSTAPGSRRPPPSAPNGSSGWPTRDAADRPRQRADGRRGSSSSSWRVPAARAARSRSRSSTSTTSGRPTREGGHVGRRRRPASRRGRPRRVGPARRHGRADRRRRVRAHRAGLGRDDVAQRVLDGIAALPAVAGRAVSVSAGVARFPVDGTDADDLDRTPRSMRSPVRRTTAADRRPSPRPRSSRSARLTAQLVVVDAEAARASDTRRHDRQRRRRRARSGLAGQGQHDPARSAAGRSPGTTPVPPGRR